MSDRHESSEHWRQLDGLRAFAVLGVLVEHYFYGQNHFTQRLGILWGEIGVQCFFVLSGFLITAILLRCRELHSNEGVPRAFLARQFYARRFLRIFPLFYFTLLVCWCFDTSRIREMWPWHATYLSNVGILVTSGDGWKWGHSGHFWTLAVEEQFYLFWPLLILCLPRRALLPSVLACISVAPLFRLIMAVTRAPWPAGMMLPPACLDTLAAGALLAWLRNDPRLASTTHWICRGALLAGCCVQATLLSKLLPHVLESALRISVGRLAWAGIFLFVVATATKPMGLPGVIGGICSLEPVVYLGRISYGMYVWHYFMIDLLNAAGAKSVFEYTGGAELRFVVLAAMTVAISSLSWYLLERPLNKLKSRFPYRGTPRRTVACSS